MAENEMRLIYHKNTQEVKVEWSRSFWRAYRRDTSGGFDMSLIPQDVRDWYDGSSDEKDTFEERENDVDTATIKNCF